MALEPSAFFILTCVSGSSLAMAFSLSDACARSCLSIKVRTLFNDTLKRNKRKTSANSGCLENDIGAVRLACQSVNGLGEAQ